LNGLSVHKSRVRANSPYPLGWLQEPHVGTDLSDFTQNFVFVGQKAEISGQNCVICNAVNANLHLYNNLPWAPSHGSVTYTATGAAASSRQTTVIASGYTVSHSQLGHSDLVGSPTTAPLDFEKLVSVALAVGLVLLCSVAVSDTWSTQTTFETVRPSDPPEEESSTLSRFQKVLETWNGLLFTNTRERLSRQLTYLLEDEEDLAGAGEPGARSFEALLGYLSARPWVGAPSLTLTRNGIFVANWRPAAQAKARLSVDFMDENRARWSAADAREGQAPTMTGGICSISELDEYLGRYQSWMSVFER
jgi:hypothetical protein